MHKVPLSEVCDYSIASTEVKKLNLSNYITTDNLLPNRGGIVNATNLPPAKSCPKFEKDNILLSNIRPYFKKIWYATFDGGCSTDVLVLKCKNAKYHPRFVYYSLFQDLFFKHMMNGAKGSKMPRGDKDQIMEFQIPDLDKPDQIRIADILNVLDAKISLNALINAELEQLARTIYNYWFVQFDYPTSAAEAASAGKPELEGKPYRSSGGEMVWNEELKREVPRGWEVGRLGAEANITMGQSPAGTSYNEIGEGISFFQGSTDFGFRFPETRMFTSEPSRFADEDDILLSVRAPVGTLNVAKERCCIGRGLAALNSKNGTGSYILYLMYYFKSMFDVQNRTGTTFGSIDKDTLHSLRFPMPPVELQRKFQSLVGEYDKMILVRSRENQELTRLRDFLLPLLMNGEVSVNVEC